MTEELVFSADAAIIGRLGEELVAKQETALMELVKNAFDADATRVAVTLGGQWGSRTISIEDDGDGMSRGELIDGFLRLAGDLKVREPFSRKFNRRRAGRKGIGRFAAQRLGRSLELTTRKIGEEFGRRLLINWDEFFAGRQLQDVPVRLDENIATHVGTTLVIGGLRDAWSDTQVKRCWRGVAALQQPFPVAPVEGMPRRDPGFSVSFLRGHGALAKSSVIANLKTEILDHLHALFEMKVNESGKAEWKISSNKFGPTQEWTQIHHDSKHGGDTYEHLKNVHMKAYYFILDSAILSPTVYTRLRDFLAAEGGIRLYRNGFRVVPYGDPHDDWLRLDEAYSKRSILAPIANRNFFGVIEISDAVGDTFEEHTSREGLIETPAFLELRDLASSVLLTAATRIADDRGRKTKAGSKPRVTAEGFAGALGDVKKALDSFLTNASVERQGEIQQAADSVARAEKAITEKILEIQATAASLADEAAMLRLLATLGMVTAEFSHETGMTFEAFRSDFAAVFAAAVIGDEDEEFLKQAARAKAMLDRLDSLTSYLNSLSSSRATRDVSPQSVSKLVEDFERGLKPQAESLGVTIRVQIPAFDPLFSRPIHGAELASILLNLYTNAVKAMIRAGGSRSILIAASRTDDGKILIRFSDTGVGIPSDLHERIFEAFFTTQPAPSSAAGDLEHASGTGLGLWIVKQIVESIGGEISVAPTERFFSTTFEVLIPAEEDGEELR